MADEIEGTGAEDVQDPPAPSAQGDGDSGESKPADAGDETQDSDQ